MQTTHRPNVGRLGDDGKHHRTALTPEGQRVRASEGRWQMPYSDFADDKAVMDYMRSLREEEGP